MDLSYPFTLNSLYPDGTDPLNPIKIYSDGVFDMFHYGHSRLFEKIKKFFPHVYLIVGVCTDEDTIQEKGLPVMNFDQRKESVYHCRWVDEVVSAPWIPTVEFLDKIGAHYIAHDAEPYPYKDMKDCYGTIKEVNRFIPTTRTEGISTTDIIVKIVENYDTYIERSIKKKVPINELHLSPSKWIHYTLLDIEKGMLNVFKNIAKEVHSRDNTKKLTKEFLDKYDSK